MTAILFPHPLNPENPLRAAITHAYRQDETLSIETLIKAAEFPQKSLTAIDAYAYELVIEMRRQQHEKGGIDAFMHEYNLSSEEGVALMCMAEAMLRIPDNATVDCLIRDKITEADWQAHLGKSDSTLVNMASWSLSLTGKMLTPQESSRYFGGIFKRLLEKASEPVIRKAVAQGMKILGKQFVMGKTIAEALKRARKQEKLGYCFSYDMLGEAARTSADAQRYFSTYQDAIKAIGAAAKGRGIYAAPGACVKLSALYPRYEFAQQERAVPILIERLTALAEMAKHYDIGLTVDAEEADRLDMSLDIFAAVAADPSLKGWDGLGLALQAYQKRAFYVIDWLVDLAHYHKRRINVRLVKGAYWDYEIKDSQVKGLEDYPVFTRKAATDVSYLACAKKMIKAGRALYPQFATHNAYMVAAISHLMGERTDFEFQCLKGMGRVLYDQIIEKNIACRVYAPVGQHQDLLPYLVRRLLENGANNSFVNQISNKNIPVAELIADPVAKMKAYAQKRHPNIHLPEDLYGAARKNSSGLDLSNIAQVSQLAESMNKASTKTWSAMPMTGIAKADAEFRAVVDPANWHNQIGNVAYSTQEDLELALTRATRATFTWDATPVEQRAVILEKIADLFERDSTELMTLAVREAGKTTVDALNEVREAVDFCRYYAEIARQILVPKLLPGPTGESNQLIMHGRGIILCISPWNFPLAIFTGQIVAALVSGNCVLAKPAEQTSLIAAKGVQLMYEAGVPNDVLQLLPGQGEVVGAAAVADARVKGVMFTGSTEVARSINQTLANRPGPIVPLIAETGGQNAMIADSTALPEQLVMDAINSAFGSAGQRCSALRVLFVQEEVAERTIELLKGAMAELKLGDPGLLATDIGPVIDADAKAILEAHVQHMRKEAKLIYQVNLSKETQYGHFFAPCAFEISHLSVLTREVFGPVLHIIRYKSNELDKVIHDINNTGYGLTLGIQTRINSTAGYIQNRAHVGNIYVNRTIIGAVVGVQPFGGEGLSGTGPKAGGPHYLARLCHERVITVNTTAAGGNASLIAMSE